MNRYQRLIEHVFLAHHRREEAPIEFDREELERAAKRLRIPLPKNLGDVIYSFRFRTGLPESVRSTAPPGKEWILRLAGAGRYRFELAELGTITPTPNLVEIKVPDATAGIVSMYALSDGQALLACLRYNRLLDVFTGVTCYLLQSHLRTSVPKLGQVETDEVYVGVDRRGAHYVFPVQAKGGTERLSIVQIEQDAAMCGEKFPDLICRPVGAQFMDKDLIALFEFEVTDTRVAISPEKHYRLVAPGDFPRSELERYRSGAA